MKQRFLVPSLLLVGLCSLGLGMAWNRVVPSTAYWASEQAEEYSIAQSELHAKAHSHGQDQEHEKEVADARERFVTIYQELQRARESRSRAGHLFLAVGVALILCGIVVHMMAGRRG